MNRKALRIPKALAWLLAAALLPAGAAPQNAPPMQPAPEPTPQPAAESARVPPSPTPTSTPTHTPTPTPTDPIFRRYMDPGIPHHRAAIELYERVKANPNDPGLHNDLGCLIARDGFWRDALREFDAAKKLAPKEGRAYFNAGLVHAQKEEWKSARGSFHDATKHDQGNWPAWWMLGFSEEQLGNSHAAIDAYKRSLRVDTSLFDVTRNPFAARTRLRARVLLETYDRRVAHAALPWSEEFAYPEKLSAFFQRTAPPVLAAGPLPTPATPEEPIPLPLGGPVVTTAPSAGSGGATRTGGSSVPTFRSVPPRGTTEGQSSRRRRAVEAEAAPPPPEPTQGTGETAAPGGVVPANPESQDTTAAPARPRARPAPVGPTPTPGIGPGFR